MALVWHRVDAPRKKIYTLRTKAINPELTNWLTDESGNMIAKSGRVEGDRAPVEVQSSNPQIDSLNTAFKGGAGNSIAALESQIASHLRGSIAYSIVHANGTACVIRPRDYVNGDVMYSLLRREFKILRNSFGAPLNVPVAKVTEYVCRSGTCVSELHETFGSPYQSFTRFPVSHFES